MFESTSKCFQTKKNREEELTYIFMSLFVKLDYSSQPNQNVINYRPKPFVFLIYQSN